MERSAAKCSFRYKTHSFIAIALKLHILMRNDALSKNLKEFRRCDLWFKSY